MDYDFGAGGAVGGFTFDSMCRSRSCFGSTVLSKSVITRAFRGIVTQIGNLLFRRLAACIAPPYPPRPPITNRRYSRQTVRATAPSALARATAASPSTQCAGRGVVLARRCWASRSSGRCLSRFSEMRIPTGFRPPAQGCDAGATLGQRPAHSPTPTGLWRFVGVYDEPPMPQPRWG
jgi:hypothetical protein